MTVCTNVRRVDGDDKPCGRALRIIGHTTKRHLPVRVCAHCDALPLVKSQ